MKSVSTVFKVSRTSVKASSNVCHPERAGHHQQDMATNAPRRVLIVKLQRQLSNLSISQLKVIVRAIDDGSITANIDESSDTDLYDLIVEFLRGDQLKSLEDEGMSQLLLLDDMITDLLKSADTTLSGDGDQTHVQREDQTILLRTPAPLLPPTLSATTTGDVPTPSPPQHVELLLQPPPSPHRSPGEDRDTGASRGLIAPSQTPRTFGPSLSGVSPSSSIRNQVLSLSDVASLLPRREFKLHGGQISDTGSDVSFGNLCKQIDDGLQEGFTESEVIRSVLKITKPGNFKEMLTNKGDLNVDELKRFLRSHIRDKNSTELFQELSNAKQSDKESPQQFLYRVMGLKQRVLFESQASTSFNYDVRLVQGTFLHTLYQGLNEKNDHVRRDLKPFLTDMQVSDDLLLEQISKSTSEEAERQKRLGATVKTKTVTVANLDSGDKTKDNKVDEERQTQRDAITELIAQVSSLTKHLTQMTKSPDQLIQVDSSPQRDNTHVQVETRGKCKPCVQQNKATCQHCFVCGQAGHRAIGCLQRKTLGNGPRSQERGSQ